MTKRETPNKTLNEVANLTPLFQVLIPTFGPECFHYSGRCVEQRAFKCPIHLNQVTEILFCPWDFNAGTEINFIVRLVKEEIARIAKIPFKLDSFFIAKRKNGEFFMYAEISILVQTMSAYPSILEQQFDLIRLLENFSINSPNTNQHLHMENLNAEKKMSLDKKEFSELTTINWWSLTYLWNFNQRFVVFY